MLVLYCKKRVLPVPFYANHTTHTSNFTQKSNLRGPHHYKLKLMMDKAADRPVYE
jgi:hypothetical protein